MRNTKPESAIEALLVKSVRAMGGRADKLISTVKGIPDRLVLLPGGRVFLVELKASDGEVSPLQAMYHAHASELGTEVVVLRSVDEVRAWGQAQCARLAPEGTVAGNKQWSPAEDEILLKGRGVATDAELASALCRTVHSIRTRHRRLVNDGAR